MTTAHAARRGRLTWLGIWPGETAAATLGFVYLFLVICSYLLIKAVRNALFISEYGAVKLPYVMLGIAVLVGMFASFYIRLARRFPTSRLVLGTLLFSCSNLAVFWWLARAGRAWLYPVLYVWAGAFGVIATTQVWTLLNEIFTTREAKRVFGFIGAGGILGGVVGGSLAYRLAPLVGTPNLLLVVLVLLLLAAGSVSLLSRHRSVRRSVAEDLPMPQSLSESLRLIARREHLRLLAALVFLTALVTTTADFQFNFVVGESIQERDALAAFFGVVYGGISLVSFVLQLLLTNRILKHLGLGVSMLILPLSMTLSSLVLLAAGVLWAAVMLKASDGFLKHSLDRTGRELFYLPLPQTIKIQSKSTIDTVMDRLGDGTAGVLLLLLTTFLGLGLRSTLIMNLVFLGCWIVVAVRLRVNYMAALDAAMGRGGVRSHPGSPIVADADTRKVLARALRSGTEAQKRGAIEWAAEQSEVDRDELLVEFVRNEASPELRRMGLGVLLGGRSGDLPASLVGCLEGEGQAVLVSAIELLTESDPAAVRAKLSELLDSVGETDRLPLVAFVVRQLGADFEPFAIRLFERLISPSSDSGTRAAAARALGLFPPDSALQDRLEALLEDPDPHVAGAAAESAGRLYRLELVPGLVRLLARPRARMAAKLALRRLGSAAAQPLIEALTDTALAPAARREIPKLLAEIGDARCSDALVRGLGAGDGLRERCLDALERIRRRRPELRPLQPEPWERAVMEACADLEARASAVAALGAEGADGTATPARSFLIDGLTQSRQAAVDRLFKFLALEYPAGDIDRVRRAVTGTSTHRKSNALEYLDNMLSARLKRRVLPLLEDRGLPKPSPSHELLRNLAEGPDTWLAASALHVARVERVPGLEEIARHAAGSDRSELREEARELLARLEGPAA